MSLSRLVDGLIARYQNGWVEVLASVSIQLVYLAFGVVFERLRPSYDSKTSLRMMAQSLRNHIAATMVHVSVVLCRGGESVLTRTYLRPYSAPSWREVVSDLVVALVLRDVLFYAVHRLWHVPGVYERVHAKHHEILDPGSHHVLTISYMSVVDFVCLYGLPVLAISKIMEMNILTTAAFAFLSAVGEQAKLVYGDEAHDEHHADGSVNFGVYGIMDSLLGTTGSGSGSVKAE